MPLTFDEKIKVLDSFEILSKGKTKPNKTNYYFEGSKVRRKVVACELTHTGNGYIFAGYLEDFKCKVDARGFIKIDEFANTEYELIRLLDRVIASFK